MTNELTLAELLDAIQGYVIGGAVRDIILGREPHDYDVVTTLTQWVKNLVQLLLTPPM